MPTIRQRKPKQCAEKAIPEQLETSIEAAVGKNAEGIKSVIPEGQESMTAKGETTESEVPKPDELEQIVRAEGLPVGEKPSQHQQRIAPGEQKTPEDL